MANRPSRAQTLTTTNKKIEFFSDFMTSFAKTPIGNQLAKITNDRSINQSLKNIILTDICERLFQPNIGCEINALLFENYDYSNISTLEYYISKSIKTNEARVNLLDIEIESTNDFELTINIYYNTINNPEKILFTYILKRVR